MRAKIMLVSGSETALGLSLFVQQILTDLAIAFGHSFVMAEEKFSALSIQEYGAAMTEETIEAAGECDGLLCLSQDEEGLAELAQGLGCLLRCRVIDLPEAMRAHSLLRSGLLPRGMIACPLSDEADTLKKAAERYFERVRELAYPVAEIPFTGENKLLWERSIRPALSKYFAGQSRRTASTAVLLKECIAQPEYLGSVMAAPAAFASISAAATALCGKAASFVYDAYWDEQGPKVYYSLIGPSAPADNLNPFGALFAACDMLRYSLGLVKESEFLLTCCRNVLDAGWRTADIAENGHASVSAQAIIQLIGEQIELAAALGSR